MDTEQANRILEILRSERPNDFEFLRLLGHGKSAAVYKARDTRGFSVAVKIYDPELASRYGHEIQQERLNREMTLIGHDCDSLVKIHDGGEFRFADQSTSHIVMEYVEGQDLRSFVTPATRLPDSRIREILNDIWTATDFLLKKQLCHRDIKTDNIRVRSGDSRAVLLDLGVLKPIASSDFTDLGGRVFLGTLRYSPPELLHRREKDDLEGWTAICIYQLGTVLYELIQGSPLFGHIPSDPYADIVSAVDYIIPQLIRSDVGEDLVDLTRGCLLKDPTERLKQVPWDEISRISRSPQKQRPTPQKKVTFDQRRLEAAQLIEREVDQPARERAAKRARESEIRKALETAFALSLEGTGLKPVAQKAIEPDEKNLLSEQISALFREDLRNRFPTPLRLLLKIDVQGEHIKVLGRGEYGLQLSHPPQASAQTQSTARSRSLPRRSTLAKWDTIADMVFDQTSATEKIGDWVSAMLNKYADLTESEFEAEVAAEAKRATSGQMVHIRERSGTLRAFRRDEDQ